MISTPIDYQLHQTHVDIVIEMGSILDTESRAVALTVDARALFSTIAGKSSCALIIPSRMIPSFIATAKAKGLRVK